MIEQKLRHLVTANPMLIEITRFRRKFFSFSTGNAMNSVTFTLGLIGYAILVLVVMQNSEHIEPISLVMFQTALLTVLAPMILYGSIAGERERRSWDLLMAAPITKAQVVAGKFIGAMAALGIAVGMMVVPIAIAAYGQHHSSMYYYSPRLYNSFTPDSDMALFKGELISVTFLMSVCALTILFSARVKRGLMALGATLGILAFFLIVAPLLLAPGAGSDHLTGDVSMFFHPFYILTRLSSNHFGSSYGLPFMWGWIQSAVFFAMSLVLLGWAANTLHFAENEVKFLPQGEKHA